MTQPTHFKQALMKILGGLVAMDGYLPVDSGSYQKLKPEAEKEGTGRLGSHLAGACC